MPYSNRELNFRGGKAMGMRRAFTIVELVVVVLILGILAAVAAPMALKHHRQTKENALRRSLRVVRDALERFYARSSHFPRENAPKSSGGDLNELEREYLRDDSFPHCMFGEGIPNGVEVVTDGVPLSGTGNTQTNGKPMWKYDSTTGEVIINYHAASLDGDTYDEW